MLKKITSVAHSLAVSLWAAWLCGAVCAQQRPDVPYVPTPWNVVEAMLDAAKVNADDYLIDLGSGDGRLVITAATRRGARATGVELNPNLVTTANSEAARNNIRAKVDFVNANLYAFDFTRATVLTMYLLPNINLDLRPRILSGLKPGTRIVSHDFDMGRWRPDVQREVPVPDKPYGPPVSQVYLWYVPAHVAGKWQWRLAAGDAVIQEVTFRQTFQQLTGDAALQGGKAAVEGAKLQGDAIAFTLLHDGDGAGRPRAYQFSGRVDGDKIAGTVKTGDDTSYDWQATRIQRGQMAIE
jgi:SAM-dependent methyltransferase